MSLYVLDSDILDLYQTSHSAVCARIQKSLDAGANRDFQSIPSLVIENWAMTDDK
jgi:hypothetical protein